jgi:hypothetical protein
LRHAGSGLRPRAWLMRNRYAVDSLKIMPLQIVYLHQMKMWCGWYRLPRTLAPPAALPEARPRRGRLTTRPFSPGLRFVPHAGFTLDSGIHYQRWCPFRGSYVLLSRKDPSFLLECPRIPALALLGGA